MRRHRHGGGGGSDRAVDSRRERVPGKRTRSGGLSPPRVDDAPHEEGAAQLPPNCPPRIPQGLAISNLDIGHLQSWARDRLRPGIGGLNEFRGWDAINERLTTSFWVRQLLVDPRMNFQPDPEGASSRQRSTIALGAELTACEQTSSGSSPTWRGALLWTLGINGTVVGQAQTGSLEFTLPDGGQEGFEAPSEAPLTESAPDQAAGPAPRKVRASDTLLEGVLGATAPGATPLLEQAGLKQLASDIAASILRGFAYAPDVLAEFWADIRDHFQEFLAITEGLLAAEVGVGILMAVPEPTMASKLIAAILQALIIAFLIYVAVTEGKAAFQHGQEWWRLVKQANGDDAIIDRAALEFMRTVFHIVMAIGAALGLRSKAHGPLSSADVPAAGESGVGVVAEGERPTPTTDRPSPVEARSPSLRPPPLLKAPRSPREFRTVVRENYVEVIKKYENVPRDQSLRYQPLLEELKNYKAGELRGNRPKIRELQDRLVETAKSLGKGDEVYDLRSLYDNIEKRDMPVWLDRLVKEGASKEDQARLMHMYRSEAREYVRQLGTDTNATEVLYLRDQAVYGKRTGPSFEDLMDQYLERGLTPEEAWDEIIGTAQRSNEDMNKAAGIQSDGRR
jgi:hypothetical protein